MHIKFILFFFLLITSHAKPILLNENNNQIELLSLSEVFIDKTQEFSVEDIKIQDSKFQKSNVALLSFGYEPKLNVWVKITLENTLNKNISRIIEYDNPLTTEVLLFNEQGKLLKKDGLFNKDTNFNNINPFFNIELKAKETKIFYIKASTKITTLIVKLNLWESHTYFNKEIEYQFALALFFGAMIILSFYNLFIYFFTKDLSYLFYVLYIVTVVIHHSFYIGIAPVYFISQENMKVIIEYSSILVSAPIIFLGLFSKYFLELKNYPKLNMILNAFLIAIFISIVLFISSEDFDKYRGLIPITFIIYLFSLTIYLSIKKNRQAYYILVGWSMIFIAIFFMFLSSLGIFHIKQYLPYYIEYLLASEALIFAIALADRINRLQKEKNEANVKIIELQKNETKSLEQKINEKTKNLKEALNNKDTLLKELNHRVKNNMQTIVSLIRLQADDIHDIKLKDILTTIQNRINAMSHLHELLYTQKNISYINTKEYFELLIDELQDSYNNHINIKVDITTNLIIDQAIYCGLIINELVTNSLKHAFTNTKGNIYINLKKEKDSITILTVEDDGKGYSKDKVSQNSLGLTLVKSLAKEQLKGKIEINSKNAVKVRIKWEANE